MNQGTIDSTLARNVAAVWAQEKLPVDAVEACAISRPTGGLGLCVNFRIRPGVENDRGGIVAATERIRIALAFLVESGVSKRYSSLQFGFAIQSINDGQIVIAQGGRFFLESNAVRRIEETPNLLQTTTVGDLVTTKELRSYLD